MSASAPRDLRPGLLPRGQALGPGQRRGARHRRRRGATAEAKQPRPATRSTEGAKQKFKDYCGVHHLMVRALYKTPFNGARII